MFVVVTGGGRSGKSAIAERIAGSLYDGQKLYLATMLACDQECERRIELHRQMRIGKNFRTVEQGTHLEELYLDAAGCVLLECMSNLVANEMYDSSGVKDNVAHHIMKGIFQIKSQTKHLVIVTNEVYSDVVRNQESKRYLEQIGQINQMLVKEADIFIEAVYGISIVHKGHI